MIMEKGKQGVGESSGANATVGACEGLIKITNNSIVNEKYMRRGIV